MKVCQTLWHFLIGDILEVGLSIICNKKWLLSSYMMLCLSKANHSRRKKFNVCGKLYLNKKIYLDIYQIKSLWFQQIFQFYSFR